MKFIIKRYDGHISKNVENKLKLRERIFCPECGSHDVTFTIYNCEEENFICLWCGLVHDYNSYLENKKNGCYIENRISLGHMPLLKYFESKEPKVFKDSTRVRVISINEIDITFRNY